MRRTLVAAIGVIALATGALVAGSTARAANGTFSLSGNATATASGVQLTSNATPPGYGAVVYTPPAGLTVAGLTNLSTDYKFTAGDCGLGAPRFSIETPSGNIFMYIGPAPNFNGCGTAQQSTGNVLASADLRCDSTQLGGPFYGSCSALASQYSSLPVLRVDLVDDNGSSTVVVNNVRVNNDVFAVVGPPTDKDQCKNGGWQTFNFPRTFKNQGDCIQFVNTGK
jgi:hypothetical protein